MKIQKYLAGFIAVLLLANLNLFAQEEMTEDEWQNEINRLTERKAFLTSELTTLQNDVNELRSALEGMQAYEDCQDELYAMVGATKADVDAFRSQVEAVEGRINRQQLPKEDRQMELDQLKANKFSALPEFYEKVHNELQRKLDAWDAKPKEIDYTVVKGDHLWGIAGKKEHYNNSFAWPKIYQANRDKIKNPDLIYPKQVFKIPNLTEEEKAKYDKIRRNYKPAPPAQTRTSN
ncbi:MAG: LysM peptidoglycan-binding domain-containing protein [Melioribacteraceae bacterium]|nr:LysM peptidoglycan-binding domain-containing protein [Melioribacteraceae bacterium]